MAEKIENKLTSQLCDALLSLKTKKELQDFPDGYLHY
jgi:hypothetical protein